VRRVDSKADAATAKHETDLPHLATRVRTGSTHNSTNFRLAILPTDAAATAYCPDAPAPLRSVRPRPRHIGSATAAIDATTTDTATVHATS